ncbi:ParA family protein [Aeoliella sp.]|uniref:ParA family protein n=1 Tax=Aeoliella sp. TaxID=2795800 RepID=UPI003CCC05FD
MIISMTNAKGGVGKTTLAVHLAAWLHLYDLKAALFDCDAQRLSSWWMKTAEPGVDVYVAEGAEEEERAVAIDELLPRLAEEYDAVVVDAPGGLGREAGAILSHADAVLIPTGTSGLDWEGLYWTTSTIKEIQKLRNEAPEGIENLNISEDERRKYLLPNAAIIPVQAEEGHVAMADLREFAHGVQFGMTTATLPYRQKHIHITPKRFHQKGLVDRPGSLMWNTGRNKEVRDAALDIDAVFQEVFPEVCAVDPYRVGEQVATRRTIDAVKWEIDNRTARRSHGRERIAS